MPRQPRLKTPELDTCYHVRSRVAGSLHWYPLQEPAVQEFFLRLLRRLVSLYFCELASFALLGSHYHLVLRFAAYRKLSRRRLRLLAKRFYPDPARRPCTHNQLKRFNHRLFDLSEFMRHFNNRLARFYNDSHDRRGPLFADRFQSSILADRQALQDCLLYVDLNALRAGLVSLPEQWEYSSAFLRCSGQNRWLMPLSEIFAECPTEEALPEYRFRLYWRGGQDGKANGCVIPQSVIEAEMRRGFQTGGVYLDRIRAFTGGGVIGSAPVISEWIVRVQAGGVYRTRKNPIPQLQGAFYTLRYQHRRPFASTLTTPDSG